MNEQIAGLKENISQLEKQIEEMKKNHGESSCGRLCDFVELEKLEMENKRKAEIAEYQQKLNNLQAEYDKLDSFRRDKERLEKDFRDLKKKLIEKDAAHELKVKQITSDFEAYKLRTKEEMLRKLREEQQKMIQLTDSHLEAVCYSFVFFYPDYYRKHNKPCKGMKSFRKKLLFILKKVGKYLRAIKLSLKKIVN
jgi:small-conductance mechanosensitive channel